MSIRKNPSESQKKRLLRLNANSCCVCKQWGVGLHFHHIDGNPSNTVDSNIAVLCVRDHDIHHRPNNYTQLNHIELGESKIREYKNSWEEFVEEAKKSKPNIVAVLSAYGSFQAIHSARLLFQWKDSRIEFERIYHLLNGSIDQWLDQIMEEIVRLGRNIQLTCISEPLRIEYCPCCSISLRNVLDPIVFQKMNNESWKSESLCSIYINPEQPSLAFLIAFKEEYTFSGDLHLCGKFIHYQDEKREERIVVRSHPSARAQVSQIVQKIIKDWEPAKILIGTGDHEEPDLIGELVLPQCWERVNRR